jgi:hypothetical protein
MVDMIVLGRDYALGPSRRHNCSYSVGEKNRDSSLVKKQYRPWCRLSKVVQEGLRHGDPGPLGHTVKRARNLLWMFNNKRSLS